MNIQQTYDRLWNKSIPLIKGNQLEADKMLNQLHQDPRRGMTLTASPDHEVIENIDAFLKKAAQLEPKQYIYPLKSLHTTVLSIITTGTLLDPNKINQIDYIKKVNEVLDKTVPFSIHFKGVTASPGAILIQGYPTDNTLELIRDQLRKTFKQSDLFTTIDTRYTLHTAHITCFRFKENKLRDEKVFAQFLADYRNTNFGVSTINRLELVINDWYMREEKIVPIHSFALSEKK